MQNINRILVGNTVPTSLIRREVRIGPVEMEQLRTALMHAGDEVYSFWGHRNTLQAAKELLDYDLTPKTERPAISLTHDGLPEFAGHLFRECWLLTPQYMGHFRPKIGVEVTVEEIKGWQVLKMEWV